MNDQREQRRARFRQELADEGFVLPEGALGEVLVDELVSARYVSVHEGIRPTYGAVIYKASRRDSEVSSGDGVPADQVRALADGVRTFVERAADDLTYLGLATLALDSETDAVARAISDDCVIVQRRDEGTISVTFAKEIWINELFTWRRQRSARSRALGVKRELRVKGDPFQLVIALLEFAQHELSPRGIGATLVIPVRPEHEPSEEGLTSAGTRPPLTISASSADDLYKLRTFLRVVDGACIFDAHGHVWRTQAKLAATKDASARLGSNKGSRHSSASWFSYDHPEYVVIVVSADGPVSVWSDGRNITSLLDDSGSQNDSVSTVPDDRDALVGADVELQCENCKSPLIVAARPGPEIVADLFCPVCPAPTPIEGVAGEVVSVTVRKPWW